MSRYPRHACLGAHTIHQDPDGAPKFWITCDDDVLGRLEVSASSPIDAPERWAKETLQAHEIDALRDLLFACAHAVTSTTGLAEDIERVLGLPEQFMRVYGDDGLTLAEAQAIARLRPVDNSTA